MEYFRLRGTGVSPGIAVGEIFLKERVIFTTRKESLSKNQIPGEMKRLKEAVGRTKAQRVFELKKRSEIKLGMSTHSFLMPI